MGKLVRDKIPQIIMSDGKNPIIRTLSDEEFLTELDKKLDEEIAEYQADKSLLRRWLMFWRCFLQSVRHADIRLMSL